MPISVCVCGERKANMKQFQRFRIGNLGLHKGRGLEEENKEVRKENLQSNATTSF